MTPWQITSVILGVLLAACTVADEPISRHELESHSWSNYHWARTSDPFGLVTVESLTADWEPHLAGANADWSDSARLDLLTETGSEGTGTRRRCSPPDGKVRVCNFNYGFNGWLGVAGIWIDPSGHIVRGYVKLNDSYFDLSPYNDPTWKQSVTCQEVGHELGLDHQDENFNNTALETCMDYQDPPWPSPNSHDYDQLDTIYAHLDSYDSYDSYDSGTTNDDDGGGCGAPPGQGCNKNSNGADAWGESLGRRGQVEIFVRDHPDGAAVVTRVVWAHSK